jgi:4-hydroxy-tetrahydrodipicolinate synthase
MANLMTSHGVIVPMLTPFTEDGGIDTAAAGRMARRLVDAGTFVFVLGTTGEGFSVSAGKREQLVRAVLNELGKGAVIYAGIPGNCLEDQIEMGNKYLELGVSAVVAHLPCYYPLSPKEMLVYFERLADNIDGPVVLYNIPHTVGQSLPVEVVDELSHRKNIIALQDTEKNQKRLHKALSLWSRREDFSYLVGHTHFVITGLFSGASGWVPISGNLVPELCRSLYDCARRGERNNAERDYRQLERVKAVCRSISEFKYAASLMGICSDFVMSPLLAADDEQKRKIEQGLIKTGLIENTSI